MIEQFTLPSFWSEGNKSIIIYEIEMMILLINDSACHMNQKLMVL